LFSAPKNLKLHNNPVKMLKWVASDREFLNEQLLRLQNVTEYMWRLATTPSERAREDYISRADAISAYGDTSLVARAGPEPSRQYAAVVKAARVKQLLSRCVDGGGSAAAGTPNGSSPRASRFLLPVSSLRWDGKHLNEVIGERWVSGIYNPGGLDPAAGDITVIVEWRGPLMGHNDQSAAGATEKRLDDLCDFLRAMHQVDKETDLAHLDPYDRNADFAMLKCLGWTTSSDAFDVVGRLRQRRAGLPVPAEGPRTG
jgi:hypothetical protein